MTPAIALMLFLLCGVLTLSSYVARIYHEKGKFLSREFQENIEVYELKVEPRLGGAASRAPLTMSVLTHLCTALTAMLLVYPVMAEDQWMASEIAQAVLAIMLVIVVFNRLLPFIFFTRTKGDWLEPFAPVLLGLIYLLLPITVVIGFCQQIAALAEPSEPVAAETQAEAVDALIEAGQEEGILEEGDRRLIQSVVEFRDKTVREVMTPRPEITAVPVTATIEEFIELIRKKPFSRAPVFEDSIDNIKGLVISHDVLQVADIEAKTRKVTSLMRPMFFVPESKPVQELMRELQRENLHFATVIDEYGSVAGVVTMEDLLEEIVGEIRDEHESKSDVIKENENAYIVPGNMDVDRLFELFGVRPENVKASTVAGLVTELLGRIPRPGETVRDDGLRFEVLQATDRVVERLRISVAQPEPSEESKPMRA
ncbi:MAG: HlyC/CorC family transporter [Acidobacteriales bacterium]|nr:HlyC/CorC family transporter [Terriglobales bacterium]